MFGGETLPKEGNQGAKIGRGFPPRDPVWGSSTEAPSLGRGTGEKDGLQRIGQLDGGDYPPSHSSRPNLSFEPLNDRDEEALPPTAKDGVLGPKCVDRTQGSLRVTGRLARHE
jgi:hypothetical protein